MNPKKELLWGLWVGYLVEITLWKLVVENSLSGEGGGGLEYPAPTSDFSCIRRYILLY